MNKLSELVFAIQCQYEFERLYRKNIPKGKGLRRLLEMLADASRIILYFAILGFGIFKGWVKMPSYLGDGYDFDNYDRNVCRVCREELQ